MKTVKLLLTLAMTFSISAFAFGQVTGSAPVIVQAADDEKQMKKDEKALAKVEKAQKKADKEARKLEKITEDIRAQERRIKQQQEKLKKLEVKLERDMAKGKLSPDDIDKAKLKILKAKVALNKDEDKLEKLRRKL